MNCRLPLMFFRARGKLKCRRVCIAEGRGTPTVFIRFNPDNTRAHKQPLASRMKTLVAAVVKLVGRMSSTANPITFNDHGFAMYFLYYTAERRDTIRAALW
jgi:hypothetical protein